MLETAFSEVYTKFKLHFYRKVFERWESREATLTTVETFCMEIIYALDRPTVNEFASFVQISPPNAAYKVNSLIRKGYLKKGAEPGGQAGIPPGAYPKILRLLQYQLSLPPYGDGADRQTLFP